MTYNWLVDYADLDQQILYLKWNLNKSNLEYHRWVEGDLADIKLKENSRASSLEEKIMKLEKEIEVLEKQKEEQLLIVESFTGIENKIIVLRYIKGYKLEKIAEELGYSPQYIRMKHAGMKATLKFLEEYKEMEMKYKNEIEHYNSEEV